MRDVSRLAGVSRMTVSRVLADPSLVAQETRDRVLKAVAQLRYVPDRVAGSLSSRRSGFVALVLPTLMNTNFADTAQAINEALREADYQLLIGFTLYRSSEEVDCIRSLLTRRPEAIIITGGVHSREANALLLESGVPVVEMWDLPERPIDYAVGFSNFEVGRAAARHLAGLGHRRIGAIGPAAGGEARDFRGEDRLEGFAAGLRECGLPDGLIIRNPDIPLSFTEGAQSISRLLDLAPDVEAVFAISDLQGVGALLECQRRGIRVPEDLSIMGFGDFEIGRQCVPSLTTIQTDSRAIGRQVAEIILNALAGQDGRETPRPDALRDIGFTVVSRGSTRTRTP
ncbi:MAG: LacI family DNA-binding transcriptional regulator [Telmatospirillum sp.]|nr:LacI family DNA-binding transcriptional regulator [Telmatospirillum sp.]